MQLLAGTDFPRPDKNPLKQSDSATFFHSAFLPLVSDVNEVAVRSFGLLWH